jgi:hypothetical protein
MGFKKQPGDVSRGHVGRQVRVKVPGAVKAALTKASLSKTTAFNNRYDFDAQPARPVTLPRLKFMERPMLEPGPREILGAKATAETPSTAEYLRDLAALRTSAPPTEPPAPEPTLPLVPLSPVHDDGAVIIEGEIAWQRLRTSPTLPDWLAVGRALLMLRKRAIEQAGSYRGIKYSRANSELLDKHGFREISKSARQSSMLMVENWPAIERWLAGFEVDRGLNHPVVIYRGWLASQRSPKHIKRHATDGTWRNRQRLEPSAFAKVYAAVRPLLPDQDDTVIKDVCYAATRALGLAVPASVYRARKHSQHMEARTANPRASHSASPT